MREQTAQASTVFDTGLDGHGERHVARRGWDIESGEQASQVGIGHLVVDDEAGVDRDDPVTSRDVDGVGVAPESVSCFIQDHVVVTAQCPGCAETRYTCTDDCN